MGPNITNLYIKSCWKSVSESFRVADFESTCHNLRVQNNGFKMVAKFYLVKISMRGCLESLISNEVLEFVNLK